VLARFSAVRCCKGLKPILSFVKKKSASRFAFCVLVGLRLLQAGLFLAAPGFGALLNASAQSATPAKPAPPITAAQRDGQHDFDFHIGTWKTHLWRLQQPLTGSNAWVEYEGTSVVRKVWNGRASLFELNVKGPAGHIEGVGLRLHNPQSRQWNLNWASSSDGKMNQPMIGEFKNGRGEFFDQEFFNGRAIFARNSFSDITPNSSRFEQAFSSDGGTTWETNWVMTFTRTKDDSDKAHAAVSSVSSPTSGAEARHPNPLLAPWSGPYGGVPPFDKVRVADFKPALLAGMDEQIANIRRIADNPAPPTFNNTIAALERSGRTLDRVRSMFGIYASTLNTPDVQAVDTEIAPLLSAHADQIAHNEKLFRRIAAVFALRESSGLSPEQQRLVWLYHTRFVHQGAQLDAASKAHLAGLNQQLASCYTKFAQNVLADENGHWLELKNEDDLAGLPPSVRGALASSSAARGVHALGAVLNTRSSVEPFLENSTRRDLRERVWRTFVNRGDNGDAHDNNVVIAEILKVRAARAKLFGFQTHADWRFAEDSMAKTPARAMALMEGVWPVAVARAREEIVDMQAVCDRENAAQGKPKIAIEPWDYSFYAEKVRRAKYDLDVNEIKPYLQLDRLREGMFWVAGQLFGLHFRPVSAGRVPVAHPDISVFEVTDTKGRHVGLWYFDPYARENKVSGASMGVYRPQERFERPVTAIVSNNYNFVKTVDGQPILISWTDAMTLFQQFGHALHGLSSNVTYPSLTGIAVAGDYVEFPAQLFGRWLLTPEVLSRFAVHYRTGKPIPEELVAKIHRAAQFNQGFKTVEYLSSALVDMELHLVGHKLVDPRAFEKEILARPDMPHEIVMRHRMPQFQHIFASDGFSAGYYSYLWADMLSADAWEAFTNGGGPYDPKVAARLRDNVFSIGNARDPDDAYRAFRGRAPDIGALMRDRGFSVRPPNKADVGARRDACRGTK
jgi:peptidyl-dipeptidase Dcp